MPIEANLDHNLEGDTLQRLADSPILGGFLAVRGTLEPRINRLATFDQDLENVLAGGKDKFFQTKAKIDELKGLIKLSEDGTDPKSNSVLAMLKSDLGNKEKTLDTLKKPVEFKLEGFFKEMIVAIVDDFSEDTLNRFFVNKRILIDALYRNFAFYLDLYEIERKAILRLEIMVSGALHEKATEAAELIRPSRDLIAEVTGSVHPEEKVPSISPRNRLATLPLITPEDPEISYTETEEPLSITVPPVSPEPRARMRTLGYEEMKREETTAPKNEYITGRTIPLGKEALTSPDVEAAHASLIARLKAVAPSAPNKSLLELAQSLQAPESPEPANDQDTAEEELPPMTPRSVERPPVLDSPEPAAEPQPGLITAEKKPVRLEGESFVSYVKRIAAEMKEARDSQAQQINPDPEPGNFGSEPVPIPAPAPILAPEIEIPEPVAEEAESKSAGWFVRAKEKVSMAIGKVKGFWNRNKRAIIFAAGLSSTVAAGVALEQKYSGTNLRQIDTQSQTAQTPTPTPSQVKSVDEKKTSDQKAEEKKEIKSEQKDVKVNSTYAARIKNSVSRPLRQMLANGEYTLGSLSILDSMIAPFKGLANDHQKAQIAHLEQEINEGLVIYFHEKFGDEAKRAESLKDPKLRNLYRTAKHVRTQDLSKKLSPQEFKEARELAIQILEKDGEELGYNVSANPDLKGWTEGNMFQAHSPVSKIKIQRADGSLSTILTQLDQIFEGGISSNLAKKPVQHSIQSPAQSQNTPATGVILPNIAPLHGGLDFNQLNQFVAPKFIAPKSTAPDTDLLDQGWSEEPNEIDSIDEGFNQLHRAMIEDEKARHNFVETGSLQLHLDKRLTRAQEKKVVLQEVVRKLTGVLGQANEKNISKVISQFGFVGFSKINFDDRGNVDVVLHPRVKAILLQSIATTKSGRAIGV